MSKLLTEYTYIHIINEDNGMVRTEIGPKRIILKGNENFLGTIQNCVIIKEGEFAILKNPYDEEHSVCQMGQRKVLLGPCVYPLKYKEVNLTNLTIGI
jgi:hypothetical protein